MNLIVKSYHFLFFIFSTFLMCVKASGIFKHIYLKIFKGHKLYATIFVLRLTMFLTVYCCFTNKTPTPRVITGPLTCFGPVNHPEIWAITQGPLVASAAPDPLGQSGLSPGPEPFSWE